MARTGLVCGRLPKQKRVGIQRINGTADAAGHIDLTSDDSWTTVGKRWAQIITRGGKENYRFNEVKADVVALVEMRSDSLTRSVTSRDRLTLGSRILDIDAAYDMNEAREKVVCHVVESKNGY